MKNHYLKRRAQFLRSIREYFYQQNVIEVDTPIMSQFGNPDPALLNFATQYNGPGELYQNSLYLITSPEYHMKRLLASGFPSCYYLGKVFRDGEMSYRHNPEFTLLEWYRVGYSLENLIDEVTALISLLVDEPLVVRYYSYRDAFMEILSIDPFMLSKDQLLETIQQQNIQLTFEPKTKDEALDILVSYIIEPAFNRDEITILWQYPATQASLSKIVHDSNGNAIGRRFEAYWRGLELANGYEELADSLEQRARFIEENEEREEYGYSKVPIDEKMLENLDQLPFCSGVAIGVDRLFMAKEGIESIADAIPFGFEEA